MAALPRPRIPVPRVPIPRFGASRSDLIDAVGRAVNGRPQRVVTSPGRVHLELRNLADPEIDRLVDALRSELAARPEVEFVHAHRPTHRIVVGHRGDLAPSDAAEAMARAEEALHLTGRTFLSPRTLHPGDVEPIVHDLLGIGADLVGITLGVAAQGLRLRPPPLEVDLAGVLSVVDGVVPVRRLVERRIGTPLADLSIGFANAVVQGLVNGPLGPMVDLAHRSLEVGELTARRQAWLDRAADLCTDQDVAWTVAGTADPRPVPVPEGPVERYADLAWIGSVAAGVATLAGTRRADRAIGIVQVGLPKAARLGRAAFASQLGRSLGERGVLLRDPEALLVLDRVDCLVVDGSVALLGRDDHTADALVGVARRCGLRTLLRTGTDPAERSAVAALLAEVGGAAARTEPGTVEQVAPDTDLGELIRRLQFEGHVVMAVAVGAIHGLAAADVALSLQPEGAQPDWGAHLLADGDVRHAMLLVRATATARTVSRRSRDLAVVGAGTGAVIAIGSPLPWTAARAPSAVNVAATLALVNGAREALDLVRRPLPQRRDPTPWHALPAVVALDRLGSSARGLTTAEALGRRTPEPRTPPLPVVLVRAIGDELVNPLTPVLTAGALLSAAVGSAIDAALVTGVVLANGVVGGVQQVRTDRAAAALGRIHRDDVMVVRDGLLRRVRPQSLVQGDVIRLVAGEAVPADCRILRADAVEADESSLTGESLPVPKQVAPTTASTVADRRSMLYDGTWIAAGEVEAVVVASGADTEARRAYALLGERPETGVEARLRGLTARMIPVSLAGGGALVGAGLVRGQPLRSTVGAAVSLAVAAVPEGLPLLATAAQLGASRRLAGRNVLVRNPRAIEALGRVDVICADKTGTLTEGRIVLRLVSDGRTEADAHALTDGLREVLAAAVRATPDAEEPTALPHPTDRAVALGGLDQDVHNGDGAAGWTLVEALPFEPARGFHATLGRTDAGRLLSVKGAPETVLPRCRSWRRTDGEVELDEPARLELDQTVTRLATRGLRVLAVAEAPTDAEAVRDEDLSGLTLLGFVGLADPARNEAAAAVDLLHRAGVRVLMVTGDHPSTASSVASDLGLLAIDDPGVVTGSDLDACSDEELDAWVAGTSVFARVTPAHKVRIVRALQGQGRTVAMTGDGANDAPAIRLADVGIALGDRSTPAARAAADLIVLDARLETIVDAVVEGRAMWASVRDAVAVLVGGNLGEIGATVVGGLVTGTSPLNARQLLVVNLLTDAVPAMAIAIRPPRHPTDDSLLREGPDASLGDALDRAIAWRAVSTAGATALAWGVGRATGLPGRASTIALATLVGTQLGQTLAVDPRDPLLLAAGLGSVAVLVTIVQTPGLSQLFGCRPLGPIAWGTAGTASALGAAVGVLGPRLTRPTGTPDPGRRGGPAAVTV